MVTRVSLSEKYKMVVSWNVRLWGKLYTVHNNPGMHAFSVQGETQRTGEDLGMFYASMPCLSHQSSSPDPNLPKSEWPRTEHRLVHCYLGWIKLQGTHPTVFSAAGSCSVGESFSLQAWVPRTLLLHQNMTPVLSLLLLPEQLLQSSQRSVVVPVQSSLPLMGLSYLHLP